MAAGKGDCELTREKVEEDWGAVAAALQEYSVRYPSEAVIEATVKSLRQHVPARRGKISRGLFKAAGLAASAWREVNMFSPAYWAAVTLLFVTGYIVTAITPIFPYVTAAGLAPFPFVIGLVELFRSRDNGMLEMELACRISFRELVLSRLLVISLYSVFLNTLFSVLLSMNNPAIHLWLMTLMWFTPLTFVSALALWLATLFRSGYAASFILTLWMAVILVLQTFPGLEDYLLSVSRGIYWFIIISGAFLMFDNVKKITSRYNPGLERWRFHELNG